MSQDAKSNRDDPPAPPIAVGVEEAARLIGVSRAAIYRMIANGTLPSSKVIGRRLIAVAALEQLFPTEVVS